MKICLLGPSFSTNNLGVCALAESSIKCILNKWPDAQVTLFGSGYATGEHPLTIANRQLLIKKFPLRFCKNVFLKCHFLVLLLNALLLKILPSKRLKKLLSAKNPWVKNLVEADIVFDITGGDSFSDIYGLRRFFWGSLCKWLVIMYGKKLILLPQTYGPFKRPIARWIAKYILKRSEIAYSRDRESFKYLQKIFDGQSANGKLKLLPDVAFVLDSYRPEHLNIDTLIDRRTKETVVVGMNINGLLFNGGYTRNNMFGLKINYPSLVSCIIESLLQNEKVVVLLVPHVFAPAGNVESDSQACELSYQSLYEKYPDRIFLTRGKYNQNEIKYIIGTCDFFIGSRMHACIAAMSQCIPSVGLAYSKKFTGVFESVGTHKCVIDMRNRTQNEIISSLEKKFAERNIIAAHLKEVIPEVKKQILNIFENL
jgi:polysaccharide pyruvyl transferase WcaK-like protein